MKLFLLAGTLGITAAALDLTGPVDLAGASLYLVALVISALASLGDLAAMLGRILSAFTR